MKVPSIHLAIALALFGVAPSANAAPPSIAYQPKSRTVVLYQATAFGVNASGTVPLSYQWRRDGVPIAGATNDQIVLAHAQFSDSGLYSVVVSNAEGRVTSADAVLTVNAPRAGDIDFSFAVGSLSINGAIHALALQPDGKVVIGGDFSTVIGAVRSRVARLNVDGTTDITFMDGLAGADNSVTSLVVQRDGKILIGGYFTNVNGVARNRIARLNADGSLDIGFLDGLSGANSTVYSVAVQSDGKVLIGGAFGDVNGAPRSAIARLNADGTLDTGFLTGFSGPDGDVRCVAGQDDGKVLIGGSFTNVNGVARNRIARLNADGSLDIGFLGELSGANFIVYSVAVQNDGKVLIGGAFGDVNGAPRSAIARLNADGTLDTGFLAGLSGANGAVLSVAEESDGKLLIGGHFTEFNGVTRNRVARLYSDGSLDNGFENNFSAAVSSIAVQSDGKAVFGGPFTTVNGVSRKYLVRLNPDGTLDGTFHIDSSGVNGDVATITLQPDGKAVLGGSFTAVNGISRNRVTRLNLDGSLDGGFLNGLSGANNAVSSILVQKDGKVCIGGAFTAVNGPTSRRIARLNPDGTLDPGFGGGRTGPNAFVDVVAVQGDGKVLIGGAFTRVSDISRERIARLNPDATTDTSFLNGLSGANGRVRSLVVQSDGKLVLGGDFSIVNGVSRNGIVRLNTDGMVDASFLNGLSGANYTVSSVVVQANGKVLLGGAFGDVNGPSRGGIARLNADGTMDTGFMAGLSGANAEVSSVAVQNDGKVLIGGYFTLVHGASRNHVARLNADGTLDIGFLNGLGGANNLVRSVVPQPDGKVLVGGDFTTFNGNTVSRIARLNPDGSLDSNFQGNSAGADGYVSSLVLLNDDKILMAGNFSTVNGVTRRGVARLNKDGSLDGDFVDVGASGVYSLAVDANGRVLMAGNFTSAGGRRRNSIAQLNADGTLDQTFRTDGTITDGVDGPWWWAGGPGISALGVQSDGKLLLGGAFTMVNGLSRSQLARLNSDGSADETFTAAIDANHCHVAVKWLHCYYYHVYCLAPQSDGKVIIGGDFGSVDGSIRNRIARLNADGTLDNTFQSGLSGANGAVYSLTLQSDGKMLIGGGFSTINGVSRNGVARLNEDGSLDSGFQEGLTGANGVVYSLVVQNDGKVLIGGEFTVVNGVNRNRIARLNPDGTLDVDFQNELLGPNASVSSLALQSDGKLIIAGAFTTVNGVPSAYIARLWANADVSPHIQNISRNTADVNLVWDAIPNRTYRVQHKEHLSATTWTDLAGDVSSAGGTATKTDRIFGAATQRYYRVILLP